MGRVARRQLEILLPRSDATTLIEPGPQSTVCYVVVVVVLLLPVTLGRRRGSVITGLDV